MRIPLFNSFFRKEKSLKNSNITLVDKLKSLSTHSDLLIFENVKIYHHQKTVTIPLIAFDVSHGIYIFEYKLWTFDDLKNAEIQKSRYQLPSENTLAFDNIGRLIEQKFNELTHRESIPIYNFLLLEQIDFEEYENLNAATKEKLPFDRIVFHNYENSDIFQMLQKIPQHGSAQISQNTLLTTLFVQYSIPDSFGGVTFANSEQRAFLDQELLEMNSLSGPVKSGKSTLLLLKSIMMLMQSPTLKIIILKPTILSCELLKKTLLEITERSIIEFDLSSLKIITPLELLNRHLKKIKKTAINTLEEIDKSLMRKNFFMAETIMCDDTDLLPDIFIEYLKATQKKSKLLLVNAKSSNEFLLTQHYKNDAHRYIFLLTNPYAKAIQLAQTILQEDDANVMIVANNETIQKLQEDFTGFLETQPAIIDSAKSLVSQHFTPLLLASYDDINALSAKHIIILDICSSNFQKVEHACNIATQSTHLLYTEECEEITNLKDRYANHQERRGVERATHP